MSRKQLVPLDMNNNKIINLDTPTSGTDAANKDYVDSHSGGVTSFNGMTGAVGSEGANIGSGIPIFNQNSTVGNETLFEFKTLVSNDGTITLTDTGSEVNISAGRTVRNETVDGQTVLFTDDIVTVASVNTIWLPHDITGHEGKQITIVNLTSNNMSIQEEISPSPLAINYYPALSKPYDQITFKANASYNSATSNWTVLEEIYNPLERLSDLESITLPANYVPYTGATSDIDMGGLNVNNVVQVSNANAPISITSWNNTPNTSGYDASIGAGEAVGEGDGGHVVAVAGSADYANSGEGNGGNIYLQVGSGAGAGAHGRFELRRTNKLEFATIGLEGLTANRTLELPDADGTLMVESTSRTITSTETLTFADTVVIADFAALGTAVYVPNNTTGHEGHEITIKGLANGFNLMTVLPGGDSGMGFLAGTTFADPGSYPYESITIRAKAYTAGVVNWEFIRSDVNFIQRQYENLGVYVNYSTGLTQPLEVNANDIRATDTNLQFSANQTVDSSDPSIYFQAGQPTGALMGNGGSVYIQAGAGGNGAGSNGGNILLATGPIGQDMTGTAGKLQISGAPSNDPVSSYYINFDFDNLTSGHDLQFPDANGTLIAGVGTNKITTGTTAPTSPAIGDLWVDTN